MRGNFMVEDMMSVINGYNILKNKDINISQKAQAMNKINDTLCSIGLPEYANFDSLNAINQSQDACIQIIESILDGGIQNSNLKQCMEYLIADRDLDLPILTSKNKNTKLTGKFGIAYDIAEANAIISGLKKHDDFINVNCAFNYLNLVDGNDLNTDDQDAVYFGDSKKLATLADVYKEYNHAISVIRTLLSLKTETV